VYGMGGGGKFGQIIRDGIGKLLAFYTRILFGQEQKILRSEDIWDGRVEIGHGIYGVHFLCIYFGFDSWYYSLVYYMSIYHLHIYLTLLPFVCLSE
jgi:hypothetical protein